MSERIGFLGLGIMGLAMARNACRAGHTLTVWNRNPARAKLLVDDGAVVAGAPREVGESSDIVFICVTNGSAVRDSLFGPNGAVTGSKRPSVVVDCSTIAPREAKEIAAELRALDVDFLDAPVTGGEAGAKAGTLTMMVGGDPATLERIRHIGSTMAKNIVHVGPIGSGQLTKCVNQIGCAVGIAAMTEALIFAEKAGLDVGKTHEVIRSGAAGSWALDNYGPKVLRGDLAPGFHARNMLKDIRIALSECETLGLPLPITGMMRELYTAMISMEGEKADELGNHGLIALYRRLAGADRTV